MEIAHFAAASNFFLDLCIPKNLLCCITPIYNLPNKAVPQFTKTVTVQDMNMLIKCSTIV